MTTELIVAIVERGKANGVVKAAAEAGARGATVFFARGSGEHVFSFFRALQVDPGKEVILILAEKDKAPALFEVIVTAAQARTKGKAIAFTVPVNLLAGLGDDKHD
jgi:nitrogen regulatory protein PII